MGKIIRAGSLFRDVSAHRAAARAALRRAGQGSDATDVDWLIACAWAALPQHVVAACVRRLRATGAAGRAR